jgi:hypothetical protein
MPSGAACVQPNTCHQDDVTLQVVVSEVKADYTPRRRRWNRGNVGLDTVVLDGTVGDVTVAPSRHAVLHGSASVTNAREFTSGRRRSDER